MHYFKILVSVIPSKRYKHQLVSALVSIAFITGLTQVYSYILILLFKLTHLRFFRLYRIDKSS